MRSQSISSLSQTWCVAKNGLDLLFFTPHFPSARFACVYHCAQFTKLWEANAELIHARQALYQLSKASQRRKLLPISLESTPLYPFSAHCFVLSSLIGSSFCLLLVTAMIENSIWNLLEHELYLTYNSSKFILHSSRMPLGYPVAESMELSFLCVTAWLPFIWSM